MDQWTWTCTACHQVFPGATKAEAQTKFLLHATEAHPRAAILSVGDGDAKLGTMPNKPKTPLRTVRVEDDLWRAAQERASSEGITVSDVLRDALKRYVNKKR